MTMESHTAKKRGPQHGTYLSGRSNSTYTNLAHADRLHYKRSQEACEELRRAMMRYYFKRNGVRL